MCSMLSRSSQVRGYVKIQLQNYDYNTQWKEQQSNKGTVEITCLASTWGVGDNSRGHGHLCIPSEWLSCGREFMTTVLNKEDF